MNLKLVVACFVLCIVGYDDKLKAPADPLQKAGESKQYKDAYARGRAEAETALKEGRATLYTYGLRNPFDNVDKDTGLIYEAIAGCVVNDEILGRAAGYNEQVMQSIAKNGPPANSLKRWEKELFDLKSYFDDQKQKQQVAHLTAGSAGSKSPDGKHFIRAVPSNLKGEGGKPSTTVGLIMTINGVDRQQREFFRTDERSADVTWGPPGSSFVVISGRIGTSATYEAIDVPTGRLIRVEMQDAPVKPAA